MDKKDIYEHLAKIYLDASQKKKKKSKKHPAIKNFLVIVLSFLLGFLVFSFVSLKKNQPAKAQFALLLQHGAAKINFNFDPASKEIYSIDLNNLNVARFKALGFSVKKTNFRDTISLRVEFTNAFREKSEIYVKNIPYKWGDYTIPLSEFKNITDWTDMSSIAFIVEEWNTKESNGVVYIDNVGLLKDN
ncbi:MAG: hypothetical protein PHY94_08005 [Candidatus Omnitrophica bacterium]|nr:hypothetical protein [Candidatus Omnitrophota bacterium]